MKVIRQLNTHLATWPGKQADLARASGVHESVLSRARRGESRLSVSNLEKIVKALNLKITLERIENDD